MKQNNITAENCRLLLAAFMETEEIDARTVSRSIGCRYSTLGRPLVNGTVPTEEFMKQAGILLAIGIKKYKKLSNAEKKKIAEAIGAAGGGLIGFASIAAAVSASGVVAGLSAAGIASGLSAIGTMVAGGMTAGVVTVAAIPIAATAAGYGIIKGVKYFFSEAELKRVEVDSRWEIEKC